MSAAFKDIEKNGCFAHIEYKASKKALDRQNNIKTMQAKLRKISNIHWLPALASTLTKLQMSLAQLSPSFCLLWCLQCSQMSKPEARLLYTDHLHTQTQKCYQNVKTDYVWSSTKCFVEFFYTQKFFCEPASF